MLPQSSSEKPSVPSHIPLACSVPSTNTAHIWVANEFRIENIQTQSTPRRYHVAGEAECAHVSHQGARYGPGESGCRCTSPAWVGLGGSQEGPAWVPRFRVW